MLGMDTGGFCGATDCAARPAGSSATMKTICGANFQDECPAISNLLRDFSRAHFCGWPCNPRIASGSLPTCFLRRHSSASSQQNRVSLCIEFLRRKTSGKPQPGVPRAGDTLKGRRSDCIALKVLRRLNYIPLACYWVPWCGLESLTDLLGLSQPSSRDHSCKATRALKLVAQFAPAFPF